MTLKSEFCYLVGLITSIKNVQKNVKASFVISGVRVLASVWKVIIKFKMLKYYFLGCEIDGTQYTGVGRNKKDAKKHCAMEALKVLYKIQYPDTLTAKAVAAAANTMPTN